MANRLQNIKIKRDKVLQKTYYKNIEYPSCPISPKDTYIISKIGDRLDLLAYDFYKDVRLWWIISKANPNKCKRDSFVIDPGLQKRIPNDIRSIYKKFNELNSK